MTPDSSCALTNISVVPPLPINTALTTGITCRATAVNCSCIVSRGVNMAYNYINQSLAMRISIKCVSTILL